MPEDPTPATGETPPAETTPPPASDDGGKGSKDALLADLAKERDRRQVAEKEAKRARELEAELAKLREASMSEQEKAVEAARAEARKEATGAANRRLVAAEVRAAAGGKLADPQDAVRFLELDQFEVDDDGEVDTKAIVKAVDQLVQDKPYLAAGATRPAGSADQGARGTPPSGPDMNSLLRAAARGG